MSVVEFLILPIRLVLEEIVHGLLLHMVPVVLSISWDDQRA